MIDGPMVQANKNEGVGVIGLHAQRNRIDQDAPITLDNLRHVMIVDIDYLLNHTAHVLATARLLQNGPHSTETIDHYHLAE